MRRKRRRRQEEGGGEGGHDGGGMLRWLLTYADMITLLMAFFILMYSMSIVNLAKFKQVAVSIRSGFGGRMEGGSRMLSHVSGSRALTTDSVIENSASVQAVSKEMDEYIEQQQLKDYVHVTIEDRGMVISVRSDDVLFPIGSAQIRPQAYKIIGKIATLLQRTENNILVEGHTCNLPIKTAQFPSNWELSASRASSVVRLLIEKYGLAPDRLATAGYAETQPIVPNDTEANRRLNRRVNIVVLTK